MPEKREPLPFTTPTIARLYMLQGKLDEAETIYRALQAERPDDPRLGKGLAEVQRRREDPELAGEPGELSTVELLGDACGGLECRYSVSEAGRRRAGLVLDAEGALTLRICAFPGEERADLPLAAPNGAVSVPDAVKGPVIAAAVGLRDEGGRFVAIAHGSLGPR
jgi:hypothetical protein